MKILLFTLCDNKLHNQLNFVSDYQIDVIHHGLSSLGHEVIDFPQRYHMYKEVKDKYQNNWHQIWGKGFTITGLLPYIDYTEQEIVRSEYDLAIVGLHHTRGGNIDQICDTLEIIREHECPIAFVDGWDRTDVDERVLTVCRENKITYFKREMDREIEDFLKPISFGFPEEKIRQDNPSKNNIFAPLIPVNQSIDSSYMSTYIYNTEEDYYNMYGRSMFGLTSKKGGVDTMRHYEIVANKCLPYFIDIENCPKNTLFNWPKDLLSDIKNLAYVNTKNREYDGQKILPHCGVIEKDNIGHTSEAFSSTLYNEYSEKLMDHFRNKLTTKAMAQYLIDNT